MVRKKGLEPPRDYSHSPLKAACLPVSPLPHPKERIMRLLYQNRQAFATYLCNKQCLPWRPNGRHFSISPEGFWNLVYENDSHIQPPDVRIVSIHIINKKYKGQLFFKNNQFYFRPMSPFTHCHAATNQLPMLAKRPVIQRQATRYQRCSAAAAASASCFRCSFNAV
jgi:hypothetical protein